MTQLPKTQCLIILELRVKIYVRFSKGLSNKPNLRTQTMDDRRPVSLGHRLVRHQLTQGSFGIFSLFLNPNIRCFDPKSSYFSQFKPRNIIKIYLSQIIKSKLRKLEAREEKKLKNPSSRTPKAPAVPTLKLKYFSVNFITWHVVFHQWVPFTHWVPSFQSVFDSLIMIKPRVLEL